MIWKKFKLGELLEPLDKAFWIIIIELGLISALWPISDIPLQCKAVIIVITPIILIFIAFFIARTHAKLEVSINQRSQPMGGRDLGDKLGIEIDPFQICVYQDLTVKAKKHEIEHLASQVWLDGKGPSNINWSSGSKYIDLIPEEEAQLTVWYATRPMPFEAELPIEVTLKIDPIITYKLDKFKEKYIDITLKFIDIYGNRENHIPHRREWSYKKDLSQSKS